MDKNQNLRRQIQLGIVCLAALFIFGLIVYSCSKLPKEDDILYYTPKVLTSDQLSTALKKPATEITSIMFAKHGDLDNITMPEYDSRNYCATIYSDSSEESLHILVSDLIIVQDSSLTDSYFIPTVNELCILKISEDTFVSQLSRELFVDLPDEQIDFILGYLFRNV